MLACPISVTQEFHPARDPLFVEFPHLAGKATNIYWGIIKFPHLAGKATNIHWGSINFLYLAGKANLYVGSISWKTGYSDVSRGEAPCFLQAT
jgi:hypothetical protein